MKTIVTYSVVFHVFSCCLTISEALSFHGAEPNQITAYCQNRYGKYIYPGTRFTSGCIRCICGPIGQPARCTTRYCPSRLRTLLRHRMYTSTSSMSSKPVKTINKNKQRLFKHRHTLYQRNRLHRKPTVNRLPFISQVYHSYFLQPRHHRPFHPPTHHFPIRFFPQNSPIRSIHQESIFSHIYKALIPPPLQQPMYRASNPKLFPPSPPVNVRPTRRSSYHVPFIPILTMPPDD